MNKLFIEIVRVGETAKSAIFIKHIVAFYQVEDFTRIILVTGEKFDCYKPYDEFKEACFKHLPL